MEKTTFIFVYLINYDFLMEFYLIRQFKQFDEREKNQWENDDRNYVLIVSGRNVYCIETNFGISKNKL